MSLFINNEFKEGSGESFSSTNPATGELLWQGKTATAEDVNQAIEAAQSAFEVWARLDFETRKNYLSKFIDLLKANQDELGEMLCKDTGKIIAESKAEILMMVKKFKISVEAYEERTGIKTKDLPVGKGVVRHKAHGVIAIFGPYNFPGHIPNGHILPALLAGNTVILKPSEQTPFISEKLIQIWQQADLPTGVINMVQGKADTGKVLAEHPGIQGLFFTGSSKVGKLLQASFGSKLGKILALELGGNNPLIAHDVSDEDAAVHNIILSAYSSAGQRCTCARRLVLVKNKASDKLLAKLTKAVQEIKVGDPMNTENFMGPVISKEQAAKLLDSQKTMCSNGAKPLVEMSLNKNGPAYLNPGLLDCTELTKDIDEEDFGPLLKVYLVKDIAAAIDKANDTSYGLSAGIFTDDEKLYQEFFFKIKAGIINWNNQITGASSSAPFGGVGDSGNFRPSAYYAADYCAYPVASIESSSLSSLKA